MATRINKYLSEVGYCSRREADRLIEEGKVTINGKITKIGTKAEEGDQVEVEGQKIDIAGLLTSGSFLKSRVEIAINEPVFPHDIAASAFDALTLSIAFHMLEFFPPLID